MSVSILVVDDDATQRLLLSKVLEKQGYLASHAANGKEALFLLKKQPDTLPSLIILDIYMPEMDGLETLSQLQQEFAEIPVIMLTGSEDSADIVTAMKRGASDFLHKPLQPEELLITVRNTLKMQVLSQEVKRLKRQQNGQIRFSDLIGHDGGLQASVALGQKAAASSIPVLISGETGVGKELFARAIHGESSRAQQPFIAVNCGAIPEKLVESTLFGHEKGAFTGATEASRGKFREADSGTIFLDEIGELPMDAQVKLLRVLQQKEVEPVGASRTAPVDIRIISATNRDLEAEVEQGRFREDLYFRLHVFPLILPPLRQRKQDIPELAEYFCQEFASEHQLPLKHFTAEAAEQLANQLWRGNVRELQNFIHRLCVISDSDTIDKTLITSQLSPHNSYNASGQSALEMITKDGTIKSLEKLEKEILNFALAHHENQIPKAAEALGLAKSTFYRKLKSWQE